MTIKKILAFIILLGYIIVNTIPYTQALENPKYKFLQGGVPNFYKEDDEDDIYEYLYSEGDKSLGFSGSIYPTYHNSVINYTNYDVPLKKEPSYHGLAGWAGFIFIEPKKLKQGINRILYVDQFYGGVNKEYITSKRDSAFGIDIICGEVGECTMSPYAGLDYSFPENYGSYGHQLYRGQSLDWGKMTLVQDFGIDRETTPDFVIHVNIEYSDFWVNDPKIYQGRLYMEVQTETTPGSGKFRKATESTRLVANYASYIYNSSQAEFGSRFSLKFLDHRNVYSLDQNNLIRDLKKIRDKFGSRSTFLEDYYNSMRYQLLAYLVGLDFTQNGTSYEEMKDFTGNPGIDFSHKEEALRECETLQIGCHIQNLGTMLKAGFVGLFSGLLNGIKSIFSWIWNNIKEYVEPFIKPIYDFAVKLIEEAKIIFAKLQIFFNDIYEIVKNLFKGGNDPTIAHNNLTPGVGLRAAPTQKLLCDKDFILTSKNSIEKDEGAVGLFLTTLKAGFGIFSIIDPIAPTNGTELCTYQGVKELHLRKNSWVDIIFVLIFGSSLMLLFLKNS